MCCLSSTNTIDAEGWARCSLVVSRRSMPASCLSASVMCSPALMKRPTSSGILSSTMVWSGSLSSSQ
ncbi:hypothetical protein KCU81_g78, partial [Aureobasidium melanogenum]